MKIEPHIHEFLNREHPGLLAVVGTLGRDACPHLVPVWYRWDGRSMHVWTLKERAWVRNLLREPKVGVSVQEGSLAVMMKGQATVATSDGPEVDEEIRRITRRYVGDDEMDAYIAEWRPLRTIVRIEARHVYVWGDRPGA